MAIFFDAPVPIDALVTFTRNVPIPSTLGLSSGMPTRNFTSPTVDFSEVVSTNRTARYRSYDGRIHVSSRDTGSAKRVPLIPLSSSLNMGEYERLQLEFARLGGSNTAVLADAIYNDAEKLTNEVYYRLEQAWGDVLTDGKLTINENGLDTEADFEVPANQIVSAATAWTDTAASTPLTNMISWADVWNAANGTMPGRVITSRRVHRLLMQNEEIVNAVHGSAAGRSWVTAQELNNLLASHNLPPIEGTYDSNVDVDGTTTRVIADDKFIWVPENLGELGFTAWGTTATAMELAQSNRVDLSFGDAAGIVGVVEKVGPPYRQFTFVDAVAMPILQDSRKLLVADVA
ncbi:major capsid protein [Nocardia farcinica]|uniref:major capsid protein n=1 Tax=Nocardia farcinica TaxID=37329 RepID=UPI001895675F|nr:major capsid protein [Nocardia farcinica]MBF6374463.1 major capsid protein [Nocardia farcinica]